MNTKKLALFAGTVIVVAGGLIYTLGIYPPASMRGGEGAIGKRDVYRAEQPADASVNPGAAPVATQTNPQPIQTNNDQMHADQMHADQMNSNMTRQMNSNMNDKMNSNMTRQMNSNMNDKMNSNMSSQMQSNMHQQ